MNLIDQVFAQQSSGSADGQGFGQFFAQGLAAGQHQQSIDIAKQQLAMELAQMPLKQTLLQQDADMNALKIQNGLRAQQNLIDTETAFSGLADTVHHAMQDAAPVDVNPFFFEVVAKHPRLAETERFQSLWKDYNTSLNAKLALQEAKNNKGFSAPVAVEVPSPRKGEPPYTAIQTGPNSFTLPQSSVTSFTTPDGSVFEQRTGAGGVAAGTTPSGLNPAVANKLEEKLANTLRSSALLDESLGLISPQTIGPMGKLNAAKEKAANILVPGSMKTPVTKAQTTFNTTAQAQYNSLKADSQINKLEAASIAKIAEVTDWFEAAQTATEKYQTLRDLTGLQSVLVSHQLNKIAPDEALKGMSLEFVDKYRKQRTITDAEMGRWIDLHGGNEAVERMILEQRK